MSLTSYRAAPPRDQGVASCHTYCAKQVLYAVEGVVSVSAHGFAAKLRITRPKGQPRRSSSGRP